jgi:hypothetical protein
VKTCLLIATLRCGRAYFFVWLVLAGLLGACGKTPTTPTPSSTAGLGSPAPQPNPQRPTLTGVVFETTTHGRHPVSGARVFVVDLMEGPYWDYGWSELSSDANGRFSAIVYQGRPVKVTAYSGTGDGLWNQSGLFQVCAVHPTVNADATVDIELTASGIRPARWESPVLSGVVFETTPEGRRPAADMAVLYSSNGHDTADVYARTDASGRYTFCGIPFGPGYVLPACTRGVTPPPGYRGTTFSVEIRGDTSLDAECS